MEQLDIHRITKLIAVVKRAFTMLLFFSAFMLTHERGKAQMLLNFGDGRNGSITINATDTIYTDTARAKITSLTNAAPAFWVNLSHVHGHFNVGDWVLLINFGSHNCGKRNYTFDSIWFKGNDSTFYIGSHLDTVLDTIYGAPLNDAEIIKVPRWHDVTLNGGVITCHPWDGYSGGVVCFLADGTFTTTSNPNGKIIADGKGFPGKAGGAPATPGVIIGTGGSGGTFPGGNGANGGGHTVPGENPSGLTIKSSCTNQKGGDGGKASYPNDGGSGNPGVVGTSHCPASLPHHKIEMGDAGASGASGHGASSGGNGGGGGASGYTLGSGHGSADPTSGTSGGNGGTGGGGGKGGNGGGFIYIKANTLNLDVSRAEVTANGTDGSIGITGGNGGDGGDGGKGADGSCNGTTTYGSGGGGTGASGGDAGDGGDGGSGGDAGYIWIAYHTSATFSSITFQTNPGGAGLAGDGGIGGDYGIAGAGGSPVDVTSCTSCLNSHYDTIHVTIKKLCDCKDAFKVLDSCNSGPISKSYGFLYKNTANGDSCIYDTATHTLTCYHLKLIGSTSTATGVADTFEYTCNMHKDCEYFFEHTPMAVSPNTNYWNTFGANFGTTGNSWNYDFSTGDLYDNGTVYCSSGCTPADTGTQESNNGDGSPPQRGKNGNAGSPGIAGSPGNFDQIQQDPADVYMNPTLPVVTGIGAKTDSLCHILKVMPNPAFDKLTVYYSTCTAGRSLMQVRNLQGKAMTTIEVESRKGVNFYTIDVRNYAPGYYILELANGNTTDKVKFVKQ